MATNIQTEFKRACPTTPLDITAPSVFNPTTDVLRLRLLCRACGLSGPCANTVRDLIWGAEE